MKSSCSLLSAIREGASSEPNDAALGAAPVRAFICALDHHGDQAHFAVRHTHVVVHDGNTTRAPVLGVEIRHQDTARGSSHPRTQLYSRARLRE